MGCGVCYQTSSLRGHSACASQNPGPPCSPPILGCLKQNPHLSHPCSGSLQQCKPTRGAGQVSHGGFPSAPSLSQHIPSDFPGGPGGFFSIIDPPFAVDPGTLPEQTVPCPPGFVLAPRLFLLFPSADVFCSRQRLLIRLSGGSGCAPSRPRGPGARPFPARLCPSFPQSGNTRRSLLGFAFFLLFFYSSSFSPGVWLDYF